MADAPTERHAWRRLGLGAMGVRCETCGSMRLVRNDEPCPGPPLTESEHAIEAMLRRMGEDERAAPLSAEDEAMLERVKAAVLGSLPSEDEP